MKNLLPLLLCLLFSILNVARATKPAHMPTPNAKSAQKNPSGQEAHGKTLLSDENNDEDVTSDDDGSMAGASDNEGENVNDADGSDAPGDQQTGDNDAGDDDGGDDGGTDQGK
jgi:hypothetical protein